jgi:hypothetical protein
MEIPPNAALLNLVATLPAQGAAAMAPVAAKAAPTIVTPTATSPAAPSGDGRSLLNPLPRGSILNIIA